MSLPGGEKDEWAGAIDLLTQVAMDPVFVHDLTGTIVDVNGLGCAALGWERSELIGRGLPDIVHPNELPIVEEAWSATVCGEARVRSVEANHLRQDGVALPVELRLRLVRIAGVARVVVLARDVTEHRRIRGEQARHRDDLQLILDAMPAFVFYKDTRNQILRVNRAVADSLGARPDDLVNTATARWYPEQADHYYQDDLHVISSGKPKLGIVEPLDSNEGRRWISTDKFPQFDDQGKVKGIVVIAQDITERRLLEGELLQAQKLESIGRLAGGVAHDFNNLLTAVLGHLEIAQRALALDSPVQEQLGAVRVAAERSADLTKQLLAFARKQLIEPRVVDVNEVLRESERLLRRVIGENIDLQVTSTDTPATVKIDPGQISQLIMNMALNARDEMPEGGTLAVSVRRLKLQGELQTADAALRPGDYVVLTVRDTGPGLSDEVRQHLFEPFFTTKSKGTGLGLAMCYGIVKQNRGHIAVTSDVNRGTMFDIYLPHADEPLPAPPPPAPASRAAPAGAGRKRILLAEDDAAVRALACSVLTGAGYDVLTASDGEEALRLATQNASSLDLLLTDVVMPRMGGAELAAKVRRELPSLRILFMSGYTGNAVATAELAPAVRIDGKVDLVPKPFRPSELLARVSEALMSAAPGGG